MNSFKKSIATVALLATSIAAQAEVIKIDATAFKPQAGLITFSEKPLNSTNPTYNPSDYGGVLGAPVVTFGGYFTGQTLGTFATCPAGAALTGCVIGSPSGTLSLDVNSPATFITGDGSNPTSPVLSGRPTFNGPIAIFFDVDVAAVGLEGGFFNGIGGTAITAFARDGSLLGSVSNEMTGIEFLGLAAQPGKKIAGLLFSLVGNEPAGFGIDNLRFGASEQIVLPPPIDVPEPASIALFGFALAGLAAFRRNRKV